MAVLSRMVKSIKTGFGISSGTFLARMIFILGSMGFFILFYILLKKPKEKYTMRPNRYTRIKFNLIIGMGIFVTLSAMAAAGFIDNFLMELMGDLDF
jgi:hypothetical protein